MTAAESGAKKHKEDWRSWLPPGEPEPEPDELVTLAELVAQLVWASFETSASEVRYLQSLGVVPRPTFQRRGNATVGVYPPWVYHVIQNALVMRRHGMEWDNIRTWLRQNPDVIYIYAADDDEPLPPIVYQAIDELVAWKRRRSGGNPTRVDIRFFSQSNALLGDLTLRNEDHPADNKRPPSPIDRSALARSHRIKN